ncbi:MULTISPECIES: GDSL-type esterase/lipase family protein [unclassified Campylobacter]|uniref:GDSL-type esterase/lipase family protein n=1 Tax=unclassified Campylobacter TaxID=2593542 RepID=UPI00123817BB|nr:MULTISPECIES: GDSL-type esterase/lipase family protein [unclassified Campylobacter]KAA6224643.1 hypothetical protein FMM54_07260 [Campylobacter sp. LR185c]KAA6225643.1 hypothetical protein FMM57_07055 [Campylobacter sp. LR286c]KAA6225762.1 hypothetical protein FMM55_05720 [Campylobacter sp. LR196d]KAA6229616.1 hypothetical protein FMM58_06810 [Campylobacter sp. LR291e]KAA6230139.1 hypothetical protein FMM56_06980 [Campylobacter sp. LR264d]
MKSKIFFFLLCFSCILKADIIDEMLAKTRNYSALKNYTSSTNLQTIKKKLKANKDIYIRVFGDSHMAADFFPSVVRNVLFKPNSVGFAFPMQPKYQQHLNIKYTSKDFELFNSRVLAQQNKDYAMGGIIASATKKGAKITLDTDELLGSKNYKVGFVFKALNNKNAFTIKDANNKTYELKAKKENQWFYKAFDLKFPLQITALQARAELGGYFILRDKNNKVLDTIAVNGAKSDLWLQWNEKILNSELKLFKNDLIILAYGSNDALSGNFDKVKYKANLKKFIKLLKKHNKNATIMIISPPTTTQKKGKTYELSPDFKLVRELNYEVAKEEKAILFDMHKFMQDSGGKNFWIEQKLSLKDVHLSTKGYELMAKKFVYDFEKLMRLN